MRPDDLIQKVCDGGSPSDVAIEFLGGSFLEEEFTAARFLHTKLLELLEAIMSDLSSLSKIADAYAKGREGVSALASMYRDLMKAGDVVKRVSQPW